MLKMEKILCPTDFSDTSLEAVKMANDLAEHFGVELVLAHVVQPVTPMPDVLATPSFDIRAYEGELRRSADKSLTELAQRMISSKVRSTTELRQGHAADNIVKLADSLNVDLIVIATHGMSGLMHYTYGSVAQKVIQHTTRPVLVVRAAAGKK
jgi:universal stress protein A